MAELIAVIMEVNMAISEGILAIKIISRDGKAPAILKIGTDSKTNGTRRIKADRIGAADV
jgi:hypothetical protein